MIIIRKKSSKILRYKPLRIQIKIGDHTEDGTGHVKLMKNNNLPNAGSFILKMMNGT